ncbi:hypothetical protein RCL1_001800 [Eukaryota sp. TZLM3-RCL]
MNSSLILLLLCAVAFAYRSGYIHMEVPDLVLSPLPQNYIRDEDLPRDFDWRNVDGKNYATVIRNQHTPQYCGSCWAHGALSALFDRVKIQRNAAFPDPNPSIQHILSCSNKYAGSCHGGHSSALYSWLTKNYAVEETCFPYEASDDTWHSCKFGSCYDCSHNLANPRADCFSVKNFTKYRVKEHGSLRGEKAYMKEIYARGPIAVGICATPELEAYKGGIFEDTKGQYCINHIVSLSGWGELPDGTKYWIMRNSWGNFWGENGYCRIVRGRNNLSIESSGWWAVPEEFY